MQPTDLALAEAVYGVQVVRALIDEGMVDVHVTDDGAVQVDWADLGAAARIWQRWNSKSKVARKAAAAVLDHERWLTDLLSQCAQQERDRIAAEARRARRAAITHNIAVQDAPAKPYSGPALSYDDLLDL